MIDALARHEVQYVIVGGWAAIQHGAVRRTDDLDICPEWSRENLGRLGAALRELGAELAISPSNTVPVPVIDGVLLSRMQIGTWQTRAGGFDILRGIPKTATSEARFEELSTRATTAEISGRAILVADLEDVVRSKRIADRPKDHEALPELDKLREAAAAARSRDAAFPSPPSQQLHQPPSPSTQPQPYRPRKGQQTHSLERVEERSLPELLPLARDYCEFNDVDPSDNELLALFRALIADPTHGASSSSLAMATDARWASQACSGRGVHGPPVASGSWGDLYVAPQARETGIGEALIEACRTECRAHGARGLTWSTAKGNVRARALYERVGARSRVELDRYWLDT